MKTLNIFSAFIFCFALQLHSQIFDEQSHKLTQFFNYVNNYYVDSLNNDKLIEEAIGAVLKQLDPHSVYVNKNDVKEMNEPLHGNYDGIGIQFDILNDTIIVIAPMPNSPSADVGIQAGDRILMVDGQNVAGIGIKTQGVRDKLLGPKGSYVNVSIKRRNTPQILDFLIRRGEIPIHSIDAAYMVKDDIAYIKINRFAANTISEFEKHIDTLTSLGMKSLIIDLRGNGGGYLNVAIDLVDELLDDDRTILYTEGLNSPRQTYKTLNKGKFEKGNLILLINEGSASASEIVAGALQDWDRAIIIGRKSFGKGLVQRPFNLEDGSIIRLTIARYFTPTGRLIQKPYSKGEKDYRMDLNNRFLHGELSHLDSIQFADSLEYRTLIHKRAVYGGGGIMPDIFMPIDTFGYSDYYRKIINKGIMNKYVVEYVDKNRIKLNQSYPDFNIYNANFVVDEKMLAGLLKMAANEGIEYDALSYEYSKNEIALQVKALIARDFWNLSNYYQIMNTINTSYLKAAEILSDKRLYKSILVGRRFSD